MSTEPGPSPTTVTAPPAGVERRAVIAGKFLPLHPGHQLVIDCALTDMSFGLRVDHGDVDVIVCDRPGEVPAAPVRAGWIRDLHPGAHVHVVADVCAWHGDDDCVPECSPRWARHLAELGLGPWTHVYGSDAYISDFAAALDAEAVLVDPDRGIRPYAGRDIRAGLADAWDVLDPVVRAGLVRRVVVLGAESTGTTTLAQDLAAELATDWVPEFGRTYSARLAADAGTIFDVEWTSQDFAAVAAGQEALEADVVREWAADTEASRPTAPWAPLVVCDTDVLATAVWHRRYLGADAPDLTARARQRPPLLYVLTSPDGVAFDQDGLRDGEQVRAPMTGWFRDVLAAQPVPWIEVRGPRHERVAAVVAWLEDHAGPASRTAPPVTA